MDIGFLIFIAVAVIGGLSDLYNKYKKDANNGENVKKVVKTKSTTVNQRAKTPDFRKVIQDTVKSVEQELVKNQPELKDSKNARRNADKAKKAAVSSARESVSVHKTEVSPGRLSAAQKSQQSLEAQIERITKDPHLSVRQKQNRINSLLMETEIDEAQFGMDMTPDNILKGVIYSEILGKPKALRK